MERYARASERATAAAELVAGKYAGLSKRDAALFVSLALGPDGSPAGIHRVMFMPTILGQASREQRAAWMPAIESGAIMGCYAQTELGHGSDVQGLETTARFIPESGQFELHSPTLSSTKWWPAALGPLRTPRRCVYWWAGCIRRARLNLMFTVSICGEPL